MDYTITTDTQNKTHILKTKHLPDFKTLLQLTEELIKQEQRLSYKRFFLDHSQLAPDNSLMTYQLAEQHAHFLTQYNSILSGSRMASLVNNSNHFGIVRMWETLLDMATLNITHMVFYQEEEAWQWLCQEPGYKHPDSGKDSHLNT